LIFLLAVADPLLEREPDLERLFSEDRERERLLDLDDSLPERDRRRELRLLDLDPERLRLFDFERLRERRLSREASINLILRPFISFPSKVSKAFFRSAAHEKQTIPSFCRIR
jgi:hypothetical protein